MFAVLRLLICVVASAVGIAPPAVLPQVVRPVRPSTLSSSGLAEIHVVPSGASVSRTPAFRGQAHFSEHRVGREDAPTTEAATSYESEMLGRQAIARENPRHVAVLVVALACSIAALVGRGFWQRRTSAMIDSEATEMASLDLAGRLPCSAPPVLAVAAFAGESTLDIPGHSSRGSVRGVIKSMTKRGRTSRIIVGAKPGYRRELRKQPKGFPLLMNRHVAQPFYEHDMRLMNFRTQKVADWEDYMKKTLYGKCTFQFSSRHQTDDIPYGNRQLFKSYPGGEGTQRERVNHLYDNPFYVRKYLEPARFRKIDVHNFEMPANFSKSVNLQEMIAAGMQYGHKCSMWSPLMLKYVHSNHDGQHIFDLVQTAACLNRACYYVMKAAEEGANFLFVGTKEQAGPLVRAAATRVGAFYVHRRWIGGTLTNLQQVKQGVDLYTSKRQELQQGASGGKSEKERMYKLHKHFEGLENMTSIPDILIAVDAKSVKSAIWEADRVGVPTVALLDSNNSTNMIDLPVPGNACGTKSIELFLDKMSEAILRGQALRANTPAGDQPAIPKEYDPWLFSKDRHRNFRRKSKRQPWMKAWYGGLKQWKITHPMGDIRTCPEFQGESLNWGL